MKTWIEYSENLSEYYCRISEEQAKKLNAKLISFNVEDINLDNEVFYSYCLEQIQKKLKNANNYYVYLIAFEEVVNPNSKVEIYKKCWKKVSDLEKLQYLTLGKEIELSYNGKLFYISVARTYIENLNKVLKIVDAKRCYRFIFLSENNYMSAFNGINTIEDFSFLNSYYEIDIQYIINKCITNHDIPCNYGRDSVGAELAFIYNAEDENNLWRENFK